MNPVRFALLLLGLITLGGCTGTDAPKGEPAFIAIWRSPERNSTRLRPRP